MKFSLENQKEIALLALLGTIAVFLAVLGYLLYL